MRRLRKFWSLPRREKEIFVEAGVLLPMTSFCVKTIAFRHVDRFLRRRWDDARSNEAGGSDDISLVETAVLRADNVLPWETLCLSRAITTYIMLRRRGIPAALLTGARMSEDAKLDAHAWVLAGGAAIGRAPENRAFTALLRIGEGPSNP